MAGGWAQLGNTIAGGGVLPGELAYEQGQSLGARTAQALEEARGRVIKNKALETLDASLKDYITDPKERAAAVAAAQSGVPLEQLSGFRQGTFNYNQRQIAADPNATDSQRAQALFSIGSNDQVIRPVGEFQSTNILHPDQGVQATALGSQLAKTKMDQGAAAADSARAAAELHRDQIEHPEKYRLGVGAAGPAGDGSQPIANEATARLIAKGLMPMPSGRALMYLGGDSLVRRSQYLAQRPDELDGLLASGTYGPPPAAGPPPATPTPAAAPPKAPAVAPPTGAAPAQPAAAAPPTGAAPAQPAAAAPTAGDIKLPEKAPTVGPNFDAAAFPTRKAMLGDLARKNATGGNNDALNRTAGHLDVYEQLMRESGNSDFRASNQLKNWFQAETGKAFPNNAKLAAQILGTEIVKSMTTIGAGTGEERSGLANSFSNAASLENATGAIQTAERLLREQAVSINQRAGASHVKDYYTNYLTPTAQRRLHVGAFDPANAAPPGAGPPPAGAGPPPPPAAGKTPIPLDAYLKSKGF